MLVRDGGGGGSGTIVVNADDLRRASAAALTTAEGLQELANRIGGRSIPELPPEIASVVPAALTGMASMLRSRPSELVTTAQELRARAFWADAADRLAAGYELDGALLEEFKAGMASGVLAKYADPFTRELAVKYLEELKEREDPGGIGGFLEDVGGGIADFAVGAFDSIKDPAVMIYHLAPGTDGWTDNWASLGKGLAHGVTHPVEFGKAMLALDALEEKGVSYWLGNLAPSVAATILTGGGGAALRGASATERLASGAAAMDKLADANRLAKAADNAGDAARAGGSSKPEWLVRMQAGNDFNLERAPFYEHNELYIDKAAETGYYRVDSYDTIKEEIVSRKHTQLAGVSETTAMRYLHEIDAKYAPGSRIAEVPSTPPWLRGQFLEGTKVLELPPQHGPIPQSVLDEARRLNVVLRDSDGHVYNPRPR